MLGLQRVTRVAVAFKVEDGSSMLRPEIANGKAWSAAEMRLGTRNLAGRVEKTPA